MRDLTLANGGTVKVADCKCEKLQKYLQAFSESSVISQVVLFGYALRSDCEEESPIGLLVMYTGSPKVFMREWADITFNNSVAIECDEWLSTRIDREDGLMLEEEKEYAEEIKQDGVVIFDKTW